MLAETSWPILNILARATVLQAQERMMFLFWVLLIVGLIVGIRWLLGKGKEQNQDSALEILRQRYARGEINKDEFEAKKKDLGA